MNTTRRFLIKGTLAGIVAGTMMLLYASIASATFLNQGFFTPFYDIASPLFGPITALLSMRQTFYFAAEPALLGLIIHMLWSALYGMLFAQLILFLHLYKRKALLGGLIYGLAVLAVMSYVVLPVVEAEPIPITIGTIGGPSFLVEHLIFGIALGLWANVATRGSCSSCASTGMRRSTGLRLS